MSRVYIDLLHRMLFNILIENVGYSAFLVNNAIVHV